MVAAEEEEAAVLDDVEREDPPGERGLGRAW